MEMADLPAHSLLEVRITVPNAETTESLARAIVREGLAASVQCLGPVATVYSWGGEVHRANEWLVLAKTTVAAYPDLRSRVLALHPHEMPEFIAVPITDTLDSYEQWVKGSVQPDSFANHNR